MRVGQIVGRLIEEEGVYGFFIEAAFEKKVFRFPESTYLGCSGSKEDVIRAMQIFEDYTSFILDMIGAEYEDTHAKNQFTQ